MSPPGVVALAGPNGAGKSTTGPPLLKETLGVTQFVNADLIAEGLAAFDPAGAAVTAGKIMLSRIKDLASSRTGRRDHLDATHDTLWSSSECRVSNRETSMQFFAKDRGSTQRSARRRG